MFFFPGFRLREPVRVTIVVIVTAIVVAAGIWIASLCIGCQAHLHVGGTYYVGNNKSAEDQDEKDFDIGRQRPLDVLDRALAEQQENDNRSDRVPFGIGATRDGKDNG